MAQHKLYFAVKALTIVGMILALYLLWEQLFHPSFQPCRINATVNCDAIISGGVSKTLGLPTPLYGLVGYIVMFVAATMQRKKLLFWTALGGLSFCLWIFYREIFELHVICPVCIACQIVIISVSVLSYFLLRKKLIKK